MSANLAARDRRALIVAMLLLAPMLGWRMLGAGTLGPGDATQALEAERDLLRRERSLLAGVPAQGRRADALVAALTSYASRVFPSRSAFETQVSELAAAAAISDARLSSSQSADDPAGAGTGPIRPQLLQLHGTTDLEGLLMLLASFRSDPRLLVAREIEATSVLDDPSPGGSDHLEVRVSIAGFVSAAESTDAGEAE